MPGKTLCAFAGYGQIEGDTITGTYEQTRAHFAALAKTGVDYRALIDALEQEGLTTFEDSWRELARTVSEELHAAARNQ